MKRLLLLSALFLQAGGQPITVQIQNPSFAQVSTVEYPAGDQCGSPRYGIPGWVSGPGSGGFVLANPNPCGIPIPPNGAGVAYVGSGGSISQDLGVSPAHYQEYKPGYTISGLYTITFDVTNRLPSYPGYFTAEIDYGTQELCDWSGWGDEVFTHVVHICASPGYLIIDKSLPNSGPPQGHYNFVLHFSSSTQAGWPLLPTNFSMTFTPTN